MEKRVYLKNQKGHRIVGLFDLPNRGKVFPVVVICHGFTGYKEESHLKSLARQLAKQGIAAFRFDFTYEVGQSYGSVYHKKFSQELNDLKSVINYVAKKKFINAKRVGLAGHSLGAQLALIYTASDQRIRVLADLAGVVYRGGRGTAIEQSLKQDSKNVEEKGYFIFDDRKVNFDFYIDLMEYDTLKFIKKIKIPTLIVHGSNDSLVPLSHPRAAYRLLRSKKHLAIIKGLPHTWRKPKDYKKVNPIVVAWFKKYL